MIAALAMACSGDKTAPTAVPHTGSTEESPGHTGTAGDSAHTGEGPTCLDTPVPPTDWDPQDDPCGILEHRLFTNLATCTRVWFEDGWVHVFDYGHVRVNVPYECRSDGPIAYLKACRVNDDGAFRFDRRTGVLTMWGFPAFVPTARDWNEHSGTILDYYFYRDSGYSPSFCGYPHTGIWSSP